jgi:hypothetical protein
LPTTGSITYSCANGVTAIDTSSCADSSDTTPNSFSFTDVTNQELNTLITSNSISITGINAPTAVSVSGNGSPQVSINGGGWTTSGSISSGQTIRVRLTSANIGSTQYVATVNIGGEVDIWRVTTEAPASCGVNPGDICPDGTVYAGMSGANKLYTTRCDLGQTWNRTSCTGTRLGTCYPDAQCQPLTANGHSAWRGPTQTELAMLRTNRLAIGNFCTTSGAPHYCNSQGNAYIVADIPGVWNDSDLDYEFCVIYFVDGRNFECGYDDCTPEYGGSHRGRCVRTGP